MDVLAAKLNTCLEYVVPEDKLYGIQLENGTWTGLVGLINRKEVDMTGVFVLMDDRRYQVVDPSIPLLADPIILTYKKPVLESDLSGFVKPYTALTWGAILATLMVVFVSMLVTQLAQTWILHHRRGRPDSSTAGHMSRDAEDHVWTSWLWTVTVTLAQSSAWWPRGESLRLVAGVWLLMALVISSIYRSNLKAMLILPKLRLPFDTLEQLLQTNIPCYVSESSVVHANVMAAKPGTQLHRLQSQMIVHNNMPRAVHTYSTGQTAVFTGRHSALYVFQKHFEQTRACPFYVGSETFFGSMALSFIFPKNSELKLKLDSILSRLREFGVVQEIIRQAVRNAEECLKSESSLPSNILRPLDLGDFYGVFSLYGGGMLLAGLTFLLELSLAVRKHPQP
ncbi:glutamate receptor 1-like isoform X2 [Panulirus ornatus]